MKKQLQIGFAVVVVLLVLESVRALAGTLDHIEIKIVTQDNSVEIADSVTASPSGISMQQFPAASPTATPEATQTEVPEVTPWPTSTSERPEIVPTSTPQVTFTPLPTRPPARYKTATPKSSGGSGGSHEGSADSTTPAPESAPTEVQEPSPTRALPEEPLPTSAPVSPPEGAATESPTESPIESTDTIPTAAPTPDGT